MLDPDPEAEDDPDAEVDTDMLPTLVVYRDGEVVHSWVRADWVITEELGDTGDLQGLLEK